MKIYPRCPVTRVDHVRSDIHILGFRCEEIARTISPGQFVNIRVHDFTQPLLRRPFSVYFVEGDEVHIIFNVIGSGTRILHRKHIEETIDVLGPLGTPFSIDGNFETAILVGGGLGVAPLPLLTAAMRSRRHVVTFLGARNRDNVVPLHLDDPRVSTDDGSEGFHGSVLDLLRRDLTSQNFPSAMMFGCGPNRMLSALKSLAGEFGLPCQVSLESAMACGIGICQGCPVVYDRAERKYGLVCKDGPAFDVERITIA